MNCGEMKNAIPPQAYTNLSQPSSNPKLESEARKGRNSGAAALPISIVCLLLDLILLTYDRVGPILFILIGAGKLTVAILASTAKDTYKKILKETNYPNETARSGNKLANAALIIVVVGAGLIITRILLECARV